MEQQPQAISFSHEDLVDFTCAVFEHFDIPRPDAQLAAGVLSASDLRGIESHGVARLLAYVGLLKEGLINPRPNLKILRETPSTAAIDADNGLGLVTGPRANEIAMEKAETVGTGWVTEFKRRIDDWIRTFRATKPAPGTAGVLIPGDPERASEVERHKNGIPLVLPVVEELREVSRMTGVRFDS